MHARTRRELADCHPLGLPPRQKWQNADGDTVELRGGRRPLDQVPPIDRPLVATGPDAMVDAPGPMPAPKDPPLWAFFASLVILATFGAIALYCIVTRH